MPPDVSPGKSILNLLKSYTWKENKETDNLEIVYLRAPITTETNV